MIDASSLLHLEWPVLATHLLDRIASPAAHERLRDDDDEPRIDAILPRSDSLEVVQTRLLHLDGLEVCLREGALLDDDRVSVGGELGRVQDIARLLDRARRDSVLNIGELADVADAMSSAHRLHAMVARVGDDGLTRASDHEREAYQAFAQAFAAMAPPGVLVELLDRSLERQGSEPRLADGASAELGNLRAREASARRSLTTAAERLLRRKGIERALADRYWTERDGRIVLPVRSDAFSRTGNEGTVAGMIHGSSGSGQTLFVEPVELIDLANARREASIAVQAEEARILARLSRMVGGSADELQVSLAALLELDLLHAKLKLAVELGATVPRMSHPVAGTRIVLPVARHPLMVLRGGEVIPNDIDVNLGGALVISGPNAGGKTVALKTLGLCVLMAQAGLRLPTETPADMPLLTTIVTDVGDDQSIAANLSTFSAHIGHVLAALQAAEREGLGSLVLLDEIAVGTDPDQGAALAEALLIALVDRGSTVVVTTHYERLKLLASADPARFTNASVGFDLAQLRPTFRLRIGAPGSSSAIAVARRLGIPESILEQAEILLTDARVRVDVLLQEIEAERERLHREDERLQRIEAQLANDRAAFEAKASREEASAASQRRRAHERATAALRGIEEDIKQRRKALKREESVPSDNSGVSDPTARTFTRDARAKILEHGPGSGLDATPSPTAVTVGSRVRVGSLGSVGEVVAIKGDRITVQLPLAKVTVALADLALATSTKKPRESKSRPMVSLTSDSARHFGSAPEPVDAKIDNVVDLRGIGAEEALAFVEVSLDRAISDDNEVVILRHGHGSGALRRAVREHLPHLKHVFQQRPGLPAEGGDAVTIVWVRL